MVEISPQRESQIQVWTRGKSLTLTSWKIGHDGLSSPFQPQNCPLPLDRSRNPQLIKMPVGALLSRRFTPAPSFLLLHQ